ncbi:hypothetical protein CNMCM5623_001606 [Aspergillus felis]|uniref:Cytochrome P450 n=1 Tax=Aspergillus felis TaxID=1287682 RepID=A0A8H6QAU5_9EURO|nr:hypothetical protein CNMCM5623_001606 [Aspergillus felis]
MRGNPHMEILDLHRKYGPILRISPNEVSFNDLDASGIIYGPTSKFEKSEYFYRPFEDQAPNLFTIRDRQNHSQDKRLISYAFSKANILQYEASIHDKAVYLMNRISERVKSGQVIPLFPAFRCMTLDTISEFAFGRSTGGLQLEEFESTIFDAIDKANHSVVFFQHFPILRELLRWANYYSLSTVPNGFLELGRAADAGFQQMHATDTWTMFKNMISSAKKKSIELKKEHLLSEAILMFVAGTDTTAAALAITLHHLLQQPEAYQRLQDEVRTVIPTLESRPSFQDLDPLPFLDACIKEGLRISCPSRFRLPRTVSDGGWNFKGHYLPPGTIVSLSPLYFLQEESIFPSPMTYNYNPARCLSIIEQKIVLSMFVRRFNPKHVLNKSIEIREAITVTIDDPLDVQLDITSD